VVVTKRPETVTVKLAATFCAGIEESLSFTMKVKVPSAVGVPEITPVEVLRERPGGSDPPATDQMYGVSPPVAIRVAEYPTPMEALGSEVVVIERGRGERLIEKPFEALSAGDEESVTVTVKLEVPSAVGVPEITPVEASRERPGGSDPLVTIQV
jgi:hypothetical protein